MNFGEWSGRCPPAIRAQEKTLGTVAASDRSPFLCLSSQRSKSIHM